MLNEEQLSALWQEYAQVALGAMIQRGVVPPEPRTAVERALAYADAVMDALRLRQSLAVMDALRLRQSLRGPWLNAKGEVVAPLAGPPAPNSQAEDTNSGSSSVTP